MPIRALIVTLLALPLLACGPKIPMEGSLAVPDARDFFQFPEKYIGRNVRVSELLPARLDTTRPLGFRHAGDENRVLFVTDARSLARKHKLRLDEIVTLVILCTEGRTDSGNLMISIVERAPYRPSLD